MKARITDKGLLLGKEWFEGCAEVEVLKSGTTLVIAPVNVGAPSDDAASRPDDAIWALSLNPILDDPMTDASLRLDEIIYGQP